MNFTCRSAFPTVDGGVQNSSNDDDFIPSISMHDDGSIIGLKVKSNNDFYAQAEGKLNGAIRSCSILNFGGEIPCQSQK